LLSAPLRAMAAVERTAMLAIAASNFFIGISCWVAMLHLVSMNLN
jgi:hypothetical protein